MQSEEAAKIRRFNQTFRNVRMSIFCALTVLVSAIPVATMRSECDGTMNFTRLWFYSAAFLTMTLFSVHMFNERMNKSVLETVMERIRTHKPSISTDVLNEPTSLSG